MWYHLHKPTDNLQLIVFKSRRLVNIAKNYQVIIPRICNAYPRLVANLKSKHQKIFQHLIHNRRFPQEECQMTTTKPCKRDKEHSIGSTLTKLCLVVNLSSLLAQMSPLIRCTSHPKSHQGQDMAKLCSQINRNPKER